MRLEWLEDILAIAETGSFHRAAERRHLSQSAFSRRIQQIEDQIGVKLFDRAHKPVKLRATTLAQSEQILILSAGLRQLLVDLRRGERMASNKLVIACQHSLTTVRLPAILHKLLLQDDSIHVKLRAANLDECRGLLLSRQADAAVVYQLPDEIDELNSDFLEVVCIGSDKLIPVFNASLQDLLKQAVLGGGIPYIAYPADVFLGRGMERKIIPFLDPALHYVPKVETALTLAAVEMAAAGTGIAWVPESLALDRIKSGQLVDLSSGLPSCSLLVNAMRLQGRTNVAGTLLWSHIHQGDGSD